MKKLTKNDLMSYFIIPLVSTIGILFFSIIYDIDVTTGLVIFGTVIIYAKLLLNDIVEEWK